MEGHTQMLDDLKYIHERDAQDALGIASKQWSQLDYDFSFDRLEFPIDHIVFAGMGGSALAARLSLTWPGYHVPFEICSTYELPDYVSDRTLCVVSSYSGNTEETVAALKDAEGRGAHIAVITSGGVLAEQAQAKQYPLALLPSGYQPRHAVLYSFKALIRLLESAGLVKTAETEKALKDASKFLKAEVEKWAPTLRTTSNPAKQLALDLVGGSPVIYAGPKLFPAAYKWKISFNENAKNVAWCGQYPEFNHNEFLGWSSHPVEKPYKVVDLLSSFEHPRIQKRLTLSDKLLSGKRPKSIIVEAQGSSMLEQLLWTVALGDFVSIYMALLNGLNPTPVELIEKFKKALDE